MIQRNEEKGSALLSILLHRTRKGAPLKRRANHPILTFVLLALGSAIAAFAVEEFLVPNTILDGGVIGEDKPSHELFSHPESPRLVTFLNKVL